MKIGYSSIDITPDLGIELSGYGWFLGRTAESVLDKLYARAVAFNDDNKKMLLINCDLIAIEKNISDYVKEKLSEKLCINRINIMIVCTHTHTGPATGKLIGCGEPDEKYRNKLADLLVEVGTLAFSNFKEVTATKSISTEIEPISQNRVIKGGPLDKYVRGISFHFNDEKPLILLSYSCHPVTLGISNKISADYPGRVVQSLNDSGYHGIFLTGICGDINPMSHKGMQGAGTEDTINKYGNRIANAAINCIKNAESMKNTVLDAFEIDIDVKLQQYKDAEIDEQVRFHQLNKENSPGIYKAVKLWAAEMKEIIKKDKNPYIENVKVQVFRIGNVAIIGFPSEVFTLIGTIIRDANPSMNILAVGNANYTMRYVPTRDDIENNGYASLASCFLYQRLPLEAGEGEHMAQVVADNLIR